MAQPPKEKGADQNARRSPSSMVGRDPAKPPNIPSASTIRGALRQAVTTGTTAPRALPPPSNQETTEGLCKTIPELGIIPYQQARDVNRRVVRLVSNSSDLDLCIELQSGVNKIGRQKNGNHIVLIGSEVSRFHAEIIVSEDAIIVRDLGSANGTIVNGRLLRECLLQAGDLVSFSDKFTFQLLVDLVVESPDTVTFPSATEGSGLMAPDTELATPPISAASFEQHRRKLEELSNKWRDTAVGMGEAAPKSSATSSTSRPVAKKPLASPSTALAKSSLTKSSVTTPITKPLAKKPTLPSPTTASKPSSTKPIAAPVAKKPLASPSTALAKSSLTKSSVTTPITKPLAKKPTLPSAIVASKSSSISSVSRSITKKLTEISPVVSTKGDQGREPTEPRLPVQPLSTAKQEDITPQSQDQVGADSKALVKVGVRADGLSTLERERRHLAVLYNVSRQCMAAENLAAVDKLLINVLERIIFFDRGFISYQLSSGDWKLVLSPKGDRWDQMMVKSLLRVAHQTKVPVTVLDSSTDNRLGSLGPDYSDARVLLPLLVKDEPVGAIFLISSRSDSFEDSAVDFLALFADIAALAIVNGVRREHGDG